MRTNRGFTILELIVTMAVIAILASMVLFALFQAQRSANESKTQATIVKLHNIIARRWDSYRTRRIPLPTRYQDPSTPGVFYAMEPLEAARFRLKVLRQLMRLEMPERWIEVAHPTDSTIGGPQIVKQPVYSFHDPSVTAIRDVKMARPALSEAYLRYYQTVSRKRFPDVPNPLPSRQFQYAECLYMIVTIGAQEEGEGLELFSEDEIGDVDDDGAPEFVDAWGMPIRFLRWPVGFLNEPPEFEDEDDDLSDSPLGHLSDIQPARQPSGVAAPLRKGYPDFVEDHDAFDPKRVDAEAFLLFPLIVSAGPDKSYDIYFGPPEADEDGNEVDFSTLAARRFYVRDDPFLDLRVANDPFLDSPNANAYDLGSASYKPLVPIDSADGAPGLNGRPRDMNVWRNGGAEVRNNRLEHYDNIHNHLIEASIR